MTHDQYIDSELEYDDGFLLDKDGTVIMWEGEEPIMKVVAEIITNKGGDILNVGFGMGIVDHFIQLKKPKSHTIIEPHPHLYKEAQKNGWDRDVTMINSCWTDAVDNFIKEGKKFDGIYYDVDTYKPGVANRSEFFKKLKYILRQDGVFSFFHNDEIGGIEDFVNIFAGEDIYNVNLIQLNVEYDDRKLKKRNGYTVRKEHYIPVVRFKK